MKIRHTQELRAATLAALLIATTAACNSGENGTGGSDEAKVIGVMTLVAADQPIERLMAGIKKQASEQGFKVKSIDANYDPQKAYSAIQTFVSQEVDGIINIAGENTALEGAFRPTPRSTSPVIRTSSAS